MSTLIKQQLFAGKFEIQGEIAKGQTGTILYGYDIGLRQEVAIKVYHSHINGGAIRGKAFVEKSRPLLCLDHSNLIKIFKVEEAENTPVIFMEFFDAPSLQHIIRHNGPLPVEDMLLLARGITEVLVHTHFQGIIHGTLHPGHVMVGPEGQIKVLDLGLSWVLLDSLSTCDDELLRPLPYFPPEIAKGELLNVSSDLYCLGFMMYEMLTGTVPYAGLPKTSIMGKLAFDQADPTFNFPDAVPESLCHLICEMTRNKAQQRLQDATHVLTIINQHLSKLPSAQESSPISSDASQSPAPAESEPTEPKEPEKASASNLAPPQPENSPKPEVKQTPKIRRPQASLDYSQTNKSHMPRNIGIAIGLILLLGLAGTLGYWYRDLLEPHLSGIATEPKASVQEATSPRTKSAPSHVISSTQNSLATEEPPPKTDIPIQEEASSQVLQKKKKPEPLSTRASLTPETELPPDQSKIPQAPTAKKSEQATSPVITQKQTPTKKLHKPENEKPSKITPTSPTIAPASSTKAITKEPTQRSISDQPASNKGKPARPLVPTPKQPEAKQPTTLKKESSEAIPIAPKNTPTSQPQTTKKKPLQKASIKNLSKEETLQKDTSASSITASENITREPIDQEIEDLLKTLDAPTNDPSSIAAP